MDAPALSGVPADMLLGQGQTAASAAELARRGHITETAQNFEASFLSTMLQTMFEGVSTDPPFGGGSGEDMWRSFMAGAMAKQMVKAGGIGLSKTIAAEMMKMQGMGAQAADGERAEGEAGVAPPSKAPTASIAAAALATRAAQPLKPLKPLRAVPAAGRAAFWAAVRAS